MKTNRDLTYIKKGQKNVHVPKGTKVSMLCMSGLYYYIDPSFFPKDSELQRDAINYEFQIYPPHIDFEGEDPEEMIDRERAGAS